MASPPAPPPKRPPRAITHEGTPEADPSPSTANAAAPLPRHPHLVVAATTHGDKQAYFHSFVQDVTDAKDARPKDVLGQFPPDARPEILQGLRENVPRLQDARRRLRKVGQDHTAIEQARHARNVDVLTRAWGNVVHAYTHPAYRPPEAAAVPPGPGMNAVSNLASITKMAHQLGIQDLEELWDETKPHGVLAQSLAADGRICSQQSTKAALASIKALLRQPQENAPSADRPSTSPASSDSPGMGHPSTSPDSPDSPEMGRLSASPGSSDSVEMGRHYQEPDDPFDDLGRIPDDLGPCADDLVGNQEATASHVGKRSCSPAGFPKEPKRQNTTSSSPEPLTAVGAESSSPEPFPVPILRSSSPAGLSAGSAQSPGPPVRLGENPVTVDPGCPAAEAREAVIRSPETPVPTEPGPAPRSSRQDDPLQRIRRLVLADEGSVQRLDPGCWYNDNIMSAGMQLLTALQPSKWMAIDSLTVRRGKRYAPLARCLAQPPEGRRKGLFLTVHAKHHWMLAVLREEHQTVEFYDSLPPGPAAYEAETVIRILLAANAPSPRARWAVRRNACPKQKNDVDCGVFCLAMAAFLVAGEAMPDSLDPRHFRVVWQVLLRGPGHQVSPTCPMEPAVAFVAPPRLTLPPSATDAGHLVVKQAHECIRACVQYQRSASTYSVGITTALRLVDKLDRLTRRAAEVARLLAQRAGARRVVAEVRTFEASAALQEQAQREVDGLDRALREAGYVSDDDGGDGGGALALAIKAALEECANQLVTESTALRAALGQARKDEARWRGVVRLFE